MPAAENAQQLPCWPPLCLTLTRAASAAIEQRRDYCLLSERPPRPSSASGGRRSRSSWAPGSFTPPQSRTGSQSGTPGGLQPEPSELSRASRGSRGSRASHGSVLEPYRQVLHLHTVVEQHGPRCLAPAHCHRAVLSPSAPPAHCLIAV